MNKKALLGTLLAVVIPLVAYLIMKSVPVVTPPQRVFYDSVVTRVTNGKETTDTVWSRVPDISFTNQQGQQVSWKDMMYEKNDGSVEGKIVVIDFFFTHCPSICPTMTQHMKKLQDAIGNREETGKHEADYVQFLSISVDPERDSVAALKKWADRFQINPDNWWLLTGNKKEIYNFGINSLKLGLVDGGHVDSNFMHPQLFMLLDKDRVIRARKDAHGNVQFYDGLDTTDLKRLANDIVLLSLEKDPRKKSFLAGKLEVIAIAFVIAAIGLVLMFTFLKRERNKTAKKEIRNYEPHHNEER